MRIVTRPSGNGASAIIAIANFPLNPEVVEALIALDELSQEIELKRSLGMGPGKSNTDLSVQETEAKPPLTCVVTTHQQNRCPIKGCGAPIDEGDVCNNGHLVIQTTRPKH